MTTGNGSATKAVDRRTFLRNSALMGGTLAVGGLAGAGPLHALGQRAAAGAPLRRVDGYGPLVLKGDLWLPQGFEYQIISRQGQPQSDGTITPGIFDGMAAYRGPENTTILIRNHENRRRSGELPVVVPGEYRYDPDPSY